MIAQRLRLSRLEAFELERLPSAEDVYLFHARARENPKDERLFAFAEVRDVTPVRDAQGRLAQVPHLERMFMECAAAIRAFQARRPTGERLQWNRVHLDVWPPLDVERRRPHAARPALRPVHRGPRPRKGADAGGRARQRERRLSHGADERQQSGRGRRRHLPRAVHERARAAAVRVRPQGDPHAPARAHLPLRDRAHADPGRGRGQPRDPARRVQGARPRRAGLPASRASGRTGRTARTSWWASSRTAAPATPRG